MSRTKNVERVENPVESFISTNGKTGAVSIKKKGENDFMEIKLPFSFVVIDADATKVGGKFSLKKDAPRFTSNLCHPGYGAVKYTVITDKSDTVLGSGKWRVIKELSALQKARFTQLIYIIFEGETGFEVSRISLHGRALSRWIEICKEFKAVPTENAPDNYVFSIEKMELMQGGDADLESFVPVFSAKGIDKDAEIITAANDCDQNLLQPWFAHYFKSLSVAPNVAQVADESQDDDDSEADFSEGVDMETGADLVDGKRDGKIASLPPK